MQKGPGLRGSLAFLGGRLPYTYNLGFARWPCLRLIPNMAKDWFIFGEH